GGVGHMHGLSAADLVAVWEFGHGKPLLQKAQRLLAVARPDETRPVLANYTIGQRDAALLALREETFGPEVCSIAECPRCGEKLELSFSTADLRGRSALPEAGSIEVAVGDYVLRLRPPNSDDVERAVANDSEHAEEELFRRCLLTAMKSGEPVLELPPEIRE